MIDLRGSCFGSWTVIEQAETRRWRRFWRCRCLCGTIRDVWEDNLVKEKSASCGCAGRTHAHSLKGIRSPTMKSYDAMVTRCTRPSSPAFAHYNSLGIGICSRWLHGENDKSAFHCFLEDMGERPSHAFTIERIDNESGYSPVNCRWATKREQARNRSTTKTFLFNGCSLTLRELGEKYSIPYNTLRERVTRRGLDIGTAISLGPNHIGRRRH